ncbi:Dyp-type peroxidase [Nostoc sp. KVJ3]|uniref:Dyp-type peroxidase n=1 Tax=Nostoc sp. KVJ3 TaxID=457945 RepID=UPI00223875A0|nr:Dyp-type peroxidase [Nostoc sp. KVJ3]MCW5315334.1 Dyp-type peroxidase [Nostoc sp. KVJ3]
MTQQIIREAPAPYPLEGQQTNEFFHIPAPNEPILNVNNIQGNILGGFNKDYQALLFLEIENQKAFKEWLKSQIDFIATASEVIAFNRLFKSSRQRRGREGAVKATWVNIAFSFEGLKKLTNDADSFTDTSFKAGLAAKAAELNDPVDNNGKPIGWVVGGPDNGKTDVIFIIASDDRADLLEEVSRILESVVTFTDGKGNAKSSGARITFLEEGANLPQPLSGHEHFGNLDGISQPGIRGRVSDNPKELLTPRQNPENPNQGKPGQDLLWPGEFVFGYEGQNDKAHKLEDSKGQVVSAGLHWANDGSYLVFRRLRQDVFKFHQFLNYTAADLNADPRKVSAKLIGRWPSGAPTVRTPEEDAPSLGNDDNGNNNFEFNGDDAPEGKFFKNDVVPPSDDATGLRCPFIAHTRKTYPRNDKTPGGGGPGPEEIDLSEVTTQTHRLLRRGIPYGPVSPSTPNNPQPDPNFVDRGLHFLAYQTSIVDQFEFVTKFWVNNANFSEEAATGHEFEGKLTLGHDPIIGQSENNKPGSDRTRKFFIHLEDKEDQPQTKELTAPEDWVIPTGGGYFFAPSISALKDVLTN